LDSVEDCGGRCASWGVAEVLAQEEGCHGDV
jgi:hypothetical protein